MGFKLPRRLQHEMPFSVGQWLFWVDTQERALQFFHEIELREGANPKEHAAGCFRYMDTKTLKEGKCYYVRAADVFHPDLWQDEGEENQPWV